MKTKLFVLLTTVLALPAWADEPLYRAPWQTYDVGDNVRPLTIDFGDLDGDGDRDAVLSLEFFGNPGVSVLLSNGDGTFAREQVYRLVDIVGDARLADFDGDSDLDIFATIPGNAGTDFRIAILKNNGAGDFGSAQYFETGDGPYGMVVADFTGNGFPDVVTADDGFPGSGRIAILKHNGQTGPNAGFLNYVEFQSGENSLRVDSADLDGDGDLDLAVGRGDFANSGSHGVSILFNDGAGNFSGLAQYSELTGAYRDSPAVHLVDIDLDGDYDLVHGAGENGSQVTTMIGVRLNNGSGVFGSAQIYRGPQGTYTPWFISSEDIDGDGWPEVIASTGGGRDYDGYVVFSSAGQGNLFPGTFYRAAKWTKDVKAEDVDGDGNQDIVTVANFSAAITVHKNEGNGSFFQPPVYPVTFIIRDMKAADVDLDKDIDLVVAGFPLFGDPAVYIMKNTGTGAFTREIYVEGISVGHLELVDLNGDSIRDLIMSPYRNTGFGFWVAINQGVGGFGPLTTYQGGSGQGAGVGVFDVNNDSAPDIVLPNSGSANNCLIFANNGDGTNFSLVNSFGDTISQPGVAGADLDHDGNIDLVLNTFQGAATFLGNGDFSFNGPFASGQIITSYELAEFDGDGNLDLAGFVPGQSGFTGSIGTMRGFGDGSFAFVVEYPAATDFEFAMNELTTFDLNADGIDDVITSNGPSSDVSLFFSNGDGTLQLHDGNRYGVGYNASNAVINDFNSDGIMDIACSVNYGDISVIFGTDPGNSGGPAVLLDANVVTGTLLDGDVNALGQSDDVFFHTRSGFGQTFVDLHHMEMTINASTKMPSPTTIDIAIESRIGHPVGTMQLRMRNWNTGQLDLIGTAAVNNSDEIDEFSGINAANYVDATGDIEVAIKHTVFVPFLAFTFESFIDRVEIIVQ